MGQILDMGGTTLTVENVRIGATKPGQTGTDLSTTELTYLDGASSANATASKAVILNSSGNLGLGVAKTIDLDSTTSTLSANAATITKYAAVVTTESLTTAAGASQALTLTLTGLVAAGDLAFVTRAGGTNTRRNFALDAVTSSNTVTVTVYNNEPTNALNGTLIFNLWVLKA